VIYQLIYGHHTPGRPEEGAYLSEGSGYPQAAYGGVVGPGAGAGGIAGAAVAANVARN